MENVVSEIGNFIIVKKQFAEQINGWFCNGSASPKMATWMY